MTDKFKNKYRIASARLSNWDYRLNAAYFVTICTKNRLPWFGKIENQVMQLSDTGKCAEEYWKEISNHFSFVILYEFVVMPNHVHGIVVIDNHNVQPVETLQCNVSTTENPEAGKNEFMASISPKPGSLSTIIRSYKSAVSKNVHLINPEFAWQERFHDHIIRNKESFIHIQDYIINNAGKWNEDKFFI